MTFLGFDVQIVTDKRLANVRIIVLVIRLATETVGGLDVVIDDASWEYATLSLREVEAWKLFVHAVLVGLRVVDVEDTSGKTRTHLSAVVSIESEGSTLAEGHVSAGELGETTCCKDRRVGSLEALVNDQTAVVNKSIVVNGEEHVLVNVSVPSCD